MSDEHDNEVRTYLMVFASLAVLTMMTVGVAYLNLPGSMGVIIAILIAVTKATLIGAFFMHLRDEGKFINFSLGVCLMLVLVLLVFVMPDLGLVEEELASIQNREIDAHAHYTGLQGHGGGAEGGH
jgi:cytochrome c oxidase subunit 4